MKKINDNFKRPGVIFKNKTQQWEMHGNIC